MPDDQSEPKHETGTRKGGNQSAVAAQNGKRMGRPPNPARKVVADAKRLTREAQEEAARNALAAVPDAGQVAVAGSAAILEAALAVQAQGIAQRLLEVAHGVVVQEADREGNPRIYSQPPSVPALIYCANRVAGAPVSKIELLDLAERLLNKKDGDAVTPPEDLLAEIASMILGLYRDAQNARQPAVRLESIGHDGEGTTHAE